jgi:hypothetical protein
VAEPIRPRLLFVRRSVSSSACARQSGLVRYGQLLPDWPMMYAMLPSSIFT